jgi:hypothetical protein
MKYKDLVYKITSSNTQKEPNMKKAQPEINKAKASVQTKDVLIGILSDDNVELSKGSLNAVKREMERTLTVLFDSPISDSFSFLPYSENTLKIMLEIFPDRNFHYVSEREEFKVVKDMKKEKLNLKMVYASMNKNQDFADKIDYLVAINKEVESSMKAVLEKKNVMIFPMEFRGTENFSQPEKLVAPDPSGWIYNSASGMWVKNWGWDGSQQIPSWSAPEDWNLNPNPHPKTGA